MNSEKILIVEDDQRLCRLITRYLERAGFQAETASNGIDMHRMLHSEDFNLLLMESIADDAAVMDVTCEEVMGAPLPTIGAGQMLERAVEMLHTAPALLVLSGGRPLSVLTRTDILSFFEAQAGTGDG